MIVRFAAEAAFELRLALQRVLEQFRQDRGPGPFRIPKMWSC
jgi:urease accessory protein